MPDRTSIGSATHVTAAAAQIAAPDKLKCTSGTWRLPLPVVKEHVEMPFLEICNRMGVKAAFCMHDLVANAGRPNRWKLSTWPVRLVEDLIVNN